MKYLIKINRESIKKNPKAGFCGPYLIPGPLLLDKDGNYYREVNKTYTLSGEPEYFFKYIPTLVLCKYCNSEFLHTELESEWRELPLEEDTWLEEYKADRICPKCQTEECCEIEYEKLQECL